MSKIRFKMRPVTEKSARKKEKFKRVIASMQDPRDRAIMMILWPKGLVLSEVKSMENINFLEKSDKGKGDVLRSEVRRGYEGLSTRW